MPKYGYIRVSLSETISGEPNVIYNYPTGEDIDTDAVFDGTKAIREFLNLRECYALWSSPRGHYFSLVTPNPASPDGSCFVLTLRLDNECALSGRRTVQLLGELKKMLVEDRSLSDDAVEHCFVSAGVPAEPERLKSWQYVRPLTSASAPKQPFCYRTYASSSELDSTLSFPSQVEYACFDRVLVVPATASLRPGSKLDRITAPVKREYTVIAPVGCTPSRIVVTDGERLTLTFTKAGFNPRSENISVGAPSPYVRYEGPALRVKTAAESGMGFVRRVPLEVRSSKGIPVNGYTINVNGRPINTMEPYIEITERDLSPNGTTEIQVASNNYKPLKVLKSPSELINCEKVELVLEPVEQGITLRLDFGGGRIFTQEITLEKNTPEYSQLHSGNFHGFRAHRLTVAGNAEVYNVDMKSPSRPVAAAVQPAVASATEAPAAIHHHQPQAPVRPVAPVFDRATPDMDKKRKDKARNTRELHKEISVAADSQSEMVDDAVEETVVGSKHSNRGLWFVVIMLVLIIAGGIAYFLLPDSEPSQEFGQEVTQEELNAEIAATGSQPTTAAASAATATPSADEAADIAYLNDNTKTWNIAELKTDKYKTLITALASGDIDAVINHEYIIVDKNLNNRIARSIADMLWAAKGSPNENANIKAMKKYVSEDGNVKVWDLYEALARVKPTEPNPAPRPRR